LTLFQAVIIRYCNTHPPPLHQKKRLCRVVISHAEIKDVIP